MTADPPDLHLHHLERGICLNHTPCASDNVKDGVTLRGALVCEGAHIMAGASVEPGAIVSFGVVIGAGHCVTGNKRLSLCRQVEVLGIRPLSSRGYPQPRRVYI